MANATKLARLLLLVSPAVVAFASPHRGQVLFGGLPVPGATISASRGNQTFTAVTDLEGTYSFPDLPDGTWKFHLEMLGFAPTDREVVVSPGAPDGRWDLQMRSLESIQAAKALPSAASPGAPGSAPAAPITSAAPALTSSASTPSIAAANAKSNGKSRKPKNAPTGSTTTQTPFQRAEVNATAPPAPPGDPLANQNVGELTQRATDGFLINGTSNNGASSPFATAAAFGNNRRGPRSLYNGNLGFNLDNSSLDARPYSLTGQDTPRPGYNHFTGLASFGGPLKIPHLIHNGPTVFVNYQWTRNRTASTTSALMPTAAERTGDFSNVLTPQGQPVTVIDPSTGQPFYGNVIPSSRLNTPQAKAAQALLNLYPLPNFDGGTSYNYQVPILGVTHQDSLQSRINEVINRRNQIFGIFALQSTRSDTPNVFGFLDTGNTLGVNAIANWRHTFTSRLYGTFGVQFSRSSARTNPYFSNRENIAGAAGITGDNQEPINWGPPTLNFGSGIQTLSDGTPSFTRNQTTGLNFDGLWNHLRHNISFGANYRRQQFNLLSQQDPRGTFGFTGAATGYDFAGFLLGIPDTSSIAFGNADKYFRTSVYDGYVQDDWRMAPNFTLNVGVRWEYWSPITERYGRLVNLDIAAGFSEEMPVVATNPVGALSGNVYPDSLIKPDKHAFQPRVGFSWRPFPASSVVVRGGYGVYYNTSVYLPVVMQMAQQSPLSKSLSVSNSAANPLTLSNGFNTSPDITTNTFAVDPNFRIGYSQILNLSVQRDLPGSLVLTALYTGTKGTRAMQEFLPNTYPAGVMSPCSTCPTGFVYLTSNGNSTRQSGQIQLRRRLHNGLTAELDYTFSKSIDDATLGGRNQSVAPSQGQTSPFAPTTSSSTASTPSGPLIAQNWLDLSAERGLSNFDQRHLATLQLQYTTGMGTGGGTLVGGWKGALFKEWTFLSQLTAGSGLPLTPIYIAAVQGTGITGTVRPEYTGAPLYDAPPGAHLNPAAYAAPLPGQWGNAGRNSIIGPSQFAWNASLGRTFRLNERFSLDTRVDSTNTLNHVTYPSWNTTFINNQPSAQFGLPMSANAMRSLQTTVRLRF